MFEEYKDFVTWEDIYQYIKDCAKDACIYCNKDFQDESHESSLEYLSVVGGKWCYVSERYDYQGAPEEENIPLDETDLAVFARVAFMAGGDPNLVQLGIEYSPEEFYRRKDCYGL